MNDEKMQETNQCNDLMQLLSYNRAYQVPRRPCQWWHHQLFIKIFMLIISVFMMIKIGGKIKAIGNVIRPRGESVAANWRLDKQGALSHHRQHCHQQSTYHCHQHQQNQLTVFSLRTSQNCDFLASLALAALEVYVKARLEGKWDSTIPAAYSWPTFEDKGFLPSEWKYLKLAPLALGSPYWWNPSVLWVNKIHKRFLCGRNTDKTPNGHITLLQSIGRHCWATVKYLLLQIILLHACTRRLIDLSVWCDSMVSTHQVWNRFHCVGVSDPHIQSGPRP